MKSDYLYGARLAWQDRDTGFVFVWYGGHGVHLFSPRGKEVALWNVGNFCNAEARPREVVEAIKGLMRGKEYLNFVE